MTPSRVAIRAKILLRLLIHGTSDGIVSMWPARSAARGVLVVRLDAIGDFILWQRSAEHLRALYPGQRIVLAANDAWASLARQLPYWDDVIPIQVSRLQTSLAYRFRTFLEIRRRGFSVAIQPTHSRSMFVGDSAVRASGAPQRVGANGDLTNLSAWQKRIADRWYTRLILTSGAGTTEIEHNRKFLLGLGWTSAATSAYRLPRVATLPPRLQFGRAYFVVFPGASWSGRQWPAEKFVQLIEITRQRHGWLPVICGSGMERELCARIVDSAAGETVNVAGQTTLAEFCELVRDAKLLIGNETSAVHIASAVGTPSVCIVGGGHFGRFVPYPSRPDGAAMATVHVPMPCFGCNWRCHLPHLPGGPVPCISAITVDAVFEAVRRIAPGGAAMPAVASVQRGAAAKGA